MTIRSFESVAAIAAFAVSAVLIGSAPATAAGMRVHAPLGYQLMCLQNPKECEGGGRAVLAMTPATMGMIQRVNTTINARIRPQNEAAGQDVWNVNPVAGDCEDYALTKRHELINMGMSPSALRLAYVKTSSGQGHAILIVESDSGEFVLDNLSRLVRPLGDTGLHLVAKASANPEKWI